MVGFIASSPYTRQFVLTTQALLRAGIPVGIQSDPGNGKSEFTKALAEDMGCEDIEVIVSRMDPAEAGGWPHVDESGPFALTVRAQPGWYDRAARGGNAIIRMDEFRDGSRAVKSALLTVVQQRELNGQRLPDSVGFIMLMNPIETSANGSELTRPMANRMAHLSYAPPPEDWFEGTLANWGAAEVPPRLAEERARVVAFLRQESNQQLLDAGPGDDDRAADGAHTSRRSWDNVAKALAQVDAGLPKELREEIRSDIILALVGEEAHLAFALWDAATQLPPAAEILAHPEAIDWAAETADRVYAMIAVATAAATAETADQLASVFLEAAKDTDRQDLGAGLVLPAIPKMMAAAGNPLDRLVQAYGPVLSAAGIGGAAA